MAMSFASLMTSENHPAGVTMIPFALAEIAFRAEWDHDRPTGAGNIFCHRRRRASSGVEEGAVKEAGGFSGAK